MSNENHIAETIDRYLEGVMSEQELAAFEQLLQEDESLARLLDETKMANEALHLARLAGLKKSIGQDLEDIPYKPNKGINPLFLTLSSLLLVAAAIYYLHNLKDKPLPETNPHISPKEETLVRPQTEEKKKPLQEFPVEAKDTSVSKDLPNTEVIVIDTVRKNPTNTTIQIDTATQKKSSVLPVDTSKVETSKATIGDSTKTAPQTTDCEATFTLTTSPSCKQTPSGTITVTDNGSRDFMLSFEDEPSQTYLNTIDELSAGSYVLVIVHEQCTYQKTVQVEEKWCPLNSSYSFNPDYNETWEIQYEQGDQGNFIIYNSRGREIYTANFGDGKEYWDGRDANGNLVTVGNYLAMIQYSDGRLEKVELTIVR